MSKLLFLLIFIISSAWAQYQTTQTNGKVTFRVQYSFGTNSSLWHQEFITPNEDEGTLRTSLDNIALNFSTPTSRNAAISNLCSNHTFDDAIRMARY